MDKYAMYLRKSRADLELEAISHDETLARHKQILSDLAARHDIFPEQITIYHELVSGESISARPEIQRLLNDLYQKKYKAVLCMEIERLARGNTRDQGEIADAFTYSGTHIITPVKEYDPNNEFDQEYFEFGLFMSRREYKTIRRRMEAGRMQSFREGNYVGSARPYGYEIQRINKKERILVPIPEEEKVVHFIFDSFTNDRKTTGQIAKELTKLHIPTTTGKEEWNRGTVLDILRNEHYTGKVRWNRRKCSKEYEDGQLTKTKRRLTPDDFIVVPGKHKAIITQEQFDIAQTLFTGTVPVKANTTIVNPLAGLLVCKECGKKIRYTEYNRNAQPRYVHIDSVLCMKKSCNADLVMESIVEGIKAAIEDFEIKMNDEFEKEEEQKQHDLMDILEKELEKQQKKKQRLFDSWESDDGTYTKDEFIERKQMYDKSIEDIKKQIQELKKSVPESVNYEEKILNLHQIIDKLNDKTINPKAKNDFLKQFIKKIDYDVEDYGRNKGCKPVLDIYLK